MNHVCTLWPVNDVEAGDPSPTKDQFRDGNTTNLVLHFQKIAEAGFRQFSDLHLLH